MKKALIVKPGRDPHCIHYEEIEAQIGTCRKCGQQKLYPAFEDPFDKGKAQKGGLYNRGKKRRKEK